MSDIDLAKKIFAKVFPQRNDDIIRINDIHNGYTNISFLFLLKDGSKYQVRISNCDDLVDRQNELNVLTLTNNNNFIYFDKQTGQAVKTWIEGYHPDIKRIYNKKFISSLGKEIKNIHCVSLDKTTELKINKIDFNIYNKHINNADMHLSQLYLDFLEKYKSDPLCLNHSDINSLNVLTNDKFEVFLIDFEWSVMAPDYWDYANWIRETNFNLKKIKKFIKYVNPKLDPIKLIEYSYVCAFFAYLWTFVMPPSLKISKYRIQTLEQVKKYYELLTHKK